MGTLIRRFFGVLLILAAVIGLLFSIGGMVALWRIQANVTSGLQNSVELLTQTLDTTLQGLDVTQVALESSVASIQALQSTVETTVKTVESAGPMVGQISKIMDTDLPDTILATQKSLRTASQSAKVIDGVLGTLSSVPFVGSSIGYNPDVPLNQALDEVAASLEDLPGSFQDMNASLKQTNSNLETFQADLSTVAASMGQIENSVAQYKAVVEGYQKTLAQVERDLKVFSEKLPNLVRTVSLAATIFLVWMAIAQIGLFAQGWEMVTRKDPARIEAQPKAAEPDDKPEVA